MFAHCNSPLWRSDDLTTCFRTDYLLTLLPLLACATSIATVLVQWIRNTLSKRHGEYKHELLVSVDEEGAEENGNVSEDPADLVLQKSVSRTDQPNLEVDTPYGEVYLVAVEFLAVLAHMVIWVITLTGDANPSKRRNEQVAAAELVVWSYVAILVALRLFTSVTRNSLLLPLLWNHTAILYGWQWVLQTMVFRSVIIHPPNRLYQTLTILDFALTSLLLAIALFSRRGNKRVLLVREDDIEPSQEPLASLISLATFSWVDGIIWTGFKKTLELSDVWNVSLSDKAETVMANFRQIKRTHVLAFRLLSFFTTELLIQGAWSALSSVFMFLPTLLLKSILEYLENPGSTPVNAAWLYVVLLFVAGLIQAIGEGQSLWIGRKICIQIRAIIVGEIYSKTLRRKAAGSTDAESAKDDSEPSKQRSFWTKVSDLINNRQKPLPQDHSVKKRDLQANNGTVINLMSIDSFKVADICSYLHFLWAATPVQLVMAITLLYRVLGYSSLSGVAIMVFVLPLNMYIAKSFTRAQKRIMAATDGRIHATNEVLQNVRIIKYFAWELRFEANVNAKRKVELQALWSKYILWASAATVWSAIPIVTTFVSFLLYTTVEKKPLVPSVAFPALSLFQLLRMPLDQLADMIAHVQESKVSVDRVEDFLNEEETEKYSQTRKGRHDNFQDVKIALENATLTWGTTSTASPDATDAFRLINVDVEFQIGKLNVIAGPTGSGKTSLLMALLGEMKPLSGRVHIPGGFVRQELRPDPATGLTESVAYCAQQAWLVNASIKENILFANEYDEDRYKDVLACCALERDLEILDGGDQTLVGEKGITMSGGQKQRISLARALYSNSRHIILDDCLSAVDAHTAKHIFEEAIIGQLMANRTCILVSHNVVLTVLEADFVVVLDNGKVVAQGLPEEILQAGVLGDELLKSRPASRGNSKVPSRTPSNLEEERSKLSGGPDLGNGSAHKLPNGDIAKAKNVDKKPVDTRIESKATGGVKFTTLKEYLRAMGPWYFWLFAALGFILTQVGSVATNLWIREWANSYHTSETYAIPAFHHSFQYQPAMAIGNGFGVPRGFIPQFSSITSSPAALIANDVDVAYYLGIYALLGAIFILICFGRELILFWGSVHASWTIHEKLLHSILRAKLTFFDSTPLGQLTNRFSRDIQSIDQEVAPVAVGMFHSAASTITIVILISVITPGFLIPGFFIACMYVATGLFYIRSSRDLKRIEAVQRSPLFQHFGETLTGVVTIRAYGDESRFIQDSNERINTHNRPFIYLWATNRWLAFRIDLAGAFVAAFSALFVVRNVGNIDAGAAGLALSYAITFTQNVLWLVRLYASNEQNMNAVERVQEYIDVEQEAAAKVPENTPPANWPSRGAVQFVNYSTRYREDLEPVLRDVSFKIEAGEKVGIVGRTGAGKSSLALALFRGLEAEQGSIIVDDINVGLIGLQDLREAITIVPQDPTLFTGTLRSNLDPFELFKDEEIFSALRSVQLIPKVGAESRPSTPAASSNASTLKASSPPHGDIGTASSSATLAQITSNSKDANKNVFNNLASPIAESGSNLSQGQRQLLCLARALLKSPKVLVMDEATASIDYATDAHIQSALRELKSNTIITIAHRLQTIIDYDKVLVLDRGEVKEYDHPWKLIQREGGAFRSMCETNGEFENLENLAKAAWQETRLVDDDS